MSTYTRRTKHPVTGKWENAEWRDDALGHHKYGVIFPSEPEEIYDPKEYELNSDYPDEAMIEKSSEVFNIVVPIIKNGKKSGNLQAQVAVDVSTGRITIDKTNGGRNWHFAGSVPQIVRAVGELLTMSADKADEVLTNK